MLLQAPSALISWSRLKAAFLILFEGAPTSDPHLKTPQYTSALSAEECATAVRNCLYNMRRCVLYPAKKSLPADFDDLLALITDVPAKCSSVVVVAPKIHQ